MEADPALQRSPDSLSQIYVPSAVGRPGPALRDRQVRGAAERRSSSTTWASSPRTRSPSTSRAAARSGARSRRSARPSRRSGCPRASSRASRARPPPSSRRSPTSSSCIGAAVLTMYIILGILYESFIHPITILSTLPSAGIGALLALMLVGKDLGRHRDHRHHPADRHREEERDHDDRLRPRRGAQRGPAAARGDLPGLPAAVPADPHDDAWRPSSAPFP